MLHPRYPSISRDCLKAEVKAQCDEPWPHGALELSASLRTSALTLAAALMAIVRVSA